MSKEKKDPLGIYSARILLNPDMNYSTIHIRQNKKGKTKKIRLPLPESIIKEESEEIKWSRYNGEKIITYQRKYYKGEPKYLLKQELVPARLSQKLESLVHQAYDELF